VVGRHLVTAIGAVGWGAAIWLVVHLRGTRRTPPLPIGGTVGARLSVVTGRVAGTLTGGLLAGLLVLGLGSRLMMRVLAATSSANAQGRLTDAEEVVGEVTLEGTIGLLVFVGLFGGVLGVVLYSLLRRWLPDRSVTAGLVTGGIGAGLLAVPSGLLDPDNGDFEILEPLWLAVLFGVLLIVTFALLGAVLMDRLAPAWPRPARTVTGMAGLLPLVLTLLVPPIAVGAALAVAIGTVRSRTDRTLATGEQTSRLLPGLIVLAAVVGGAWTLASATQILTS
jgi:MFS family permease